MKVMQTIYAMGCKDQTDLQKEGKFTDDSLAQLYNLYLLMLDLLVEVHAFAKAEQEKHAKKILATEADKNPNTCLLYTSPSPRDRQKSRMPSSA